VSSIVPAFSKATSGIDSIVLKMGDPQAQQNRRGALVAIARGLERGKRLALDAEVLARHANDHRERRERPVMQEVKR
jgi:hypothetical protein